MILLYKKWIKNSRKVAKSIVNSTWMFFLIYSLNQRRHILLNFQNKISETKKYKNCILKYLNSNMKVKNKKNIKV